MQLLSVLANENTTSHLKNVILSEAKNLYHGKLETLTALRTAHVSVATNAPSE